jgi:hypothetical protein
MKAILKAGGEESLRPSFLETRPFAFLDQLASELQERLWQ